MYFRDKNARPIPVENFKKASVRALPKNRNLSIENENENSKSSNWAITFIVIAVLFSIGGGIWFTKNIKNKQKQKFGFHFY